MKKTHIARLLLIIAALAIGGGLGYKLLIGFEPIKITVFVVSITILGNVFYQIDKKIYIQTREGQVNSGLMEVSV